MIAHENGAGAAELSAAPAVAQVMRGFRICHRGELWQLGKWSTVGAIRGAYKRGALPGRGHYFRPETLRAFGSVRMDVPARGVTVELQRDETLGDRYVVGLWLENRRADLGAIGYPYPWHAATFDTAADARAFALELAAAWRHDAAAYGAGELAR